ncbi:MAG: hydrogenase expression protein HypE [Acidimicrobiales bacterium]
MWLSCGGCEGCTMAVLGAMGPRLEELLSGHLTHIPRIQLVHPALALEAGEAYLAALDQAVSGQLEPFLLVVEGSLFDEARAGDGSFSGLGHRAGRRIPVEQWVLDLAPMASAVIAIGTCATWGGIPAADGNVTGAMGLPAFLGPAFRARSGLPLVNVPGCAPSGDAFIEVISYTLLHLGGIVPLALDDEGRPRWLYADSTPLARARQPGRQRELGPHVTADCPVPRLGWINHIGGCAAVGGACNGCTRPDFPDVTLRLLVGH